MNLKKTLAIALCTLTGICLIPETPADARTVRASATYYSNYYNGRRMANGRRFSQSAMVAAHPTYRLGTRLRVRYKNRSVVVTVMDRCHCSLDLSKAAFRRLAPLKKGRIPVRVTKL
jgi:rare lipoprotein A